MNSISTEAIEATRRMITAYTQGCYHTVLFAQMQSGKTNAFLFLACEMIRLQHVSRVVIFSGNHEVDLKRQLETDLEGTAFHTKYVTYLLSLLPDQVPDRYLAKRTMRDIVDRIKVIWGQDLLKSAPFLSRSNHTLYIFEESHFAQSMSQVPHQFIKQLNLPLNGHRKLSHQQKQYVCSVSATPFSELSDIWHLNQPKVVVNMQPGPLYRGVEWLQQHQRIHAVSNWETTLHQVLGKAGITYRLHPQKCWGIIRVVSQSNEDRAKQIAREQLWDVKVYNQHTSDLNSMQDLLAPPTRACTLIIIKERCRMGTVVPKSHLAFVFETALHSKTDTMLQGLLGRACGYHTNDTLDVYLNEALVQSGEIENYIKLCKGEASCIPIGQNISGTKTCYLGKDVVQVIRPVIPIRVGKAHITVTPTADHLEAIQLDISNALELKPDEEPDVDNANPESITRALLKLIKKNHLMTMKKIIRLSTKGQQGKTADKLTSAMATRTPTLFGFSRKDPSLNVYYVDTDDLPGMTKGDYFLVPYLSLSQQDVLTLYNQRVVVAPPRTNGKEIFCIGQTVGQKRNRRQAQAQRPEEPDNPEMEEDVVCYVENGGYNYDYNPVSAQSPRNMNALLGLLDKCIRDGQSDNLRCVLHSTTHDKQCVYVNEQVYESLLSGGAIYNYIWDTHQLVITPHKMPRSPLPPLVALYRITWHRIS